jgi:hypothetical protein
MESTNQSLELSKCKYHVIRYTFRPSGKADLVTEGLPPTKLTVKDKDSNTIDIQYVSNKEAIKYLGCWKAPKGQEQEKQVLTDKCTIFAKAINCSHLKRK